MSSRVHAGNRPTAVSLHRRELAARSTRPRPTPLRSSASPIRPGPGPGAARDPRPPRTPGVPHRLHALHARHHGRPSGAHTDHPARRERGTRCRDPLQPPSHLYARQRGIRGSRATDRPEVPDGYRAARARRSGPPAADRAALDRVAQRREPHARQVARPRAPHHAGGRRPNASIRPAGTTRTTVSSVRSAAEHGWAAACSVASPYRTP